MAAILAAVVPLIIALLPYLEKLVVVLAQRRHDRRHPMTERRLAKTMHLCGRLREVCQHIEDGGATWGIAAQDEDVPEQVIHGES